MRINKPIILLFTFFYLIVSGFGITADNLSVFSDGALNIFATSALTESAEAAASSDALLITSPANGTTVPHDISSFAVSLPSRITETIFTLDGKVLGKGEADGSFTLSDPLTLGKHTLTVSAIYDDGRGEKVSSQFTVAIIPGSHTKDFEEYTSLSDAGTAMNASTVASNLDLWSAHDNPKYYVYKDSITNSLALKFNNEKTSENSVAQSLAYFYADGSKKNYRAGVVGLEFDFYLKKYSGIYMQLIPYSAGGHSFSLSDRGQNIIENGVIRGTSTSITTGWHHLKAVVDLDKMKVDITVDSTPMTQKDLTFPTASGQNNLYMYRIGISTNPGTYWSIDNIKTYEIGNYSGADEIFFEDLSHPSANSDGLVSADMAEVSRSTQKLVLKVNKKLKPESVSASSISVIAAGKNVPLAAAPVYDAGAKTITLTLDNASGITGNGESYVKLSESIQYENGIAAGTAAINRFNLTPDGFLIKSVDFKCGVSDLFASSQLDVGDAVKADIIIQNVASSDANLTAVLVVKSGNKIISVTPKDITASANTPNYPASIQAPALTTKEDIKASLIFVDNLKNAHYIDSYDLI